MTGIISQKKIRKVSSSSKKANGTSLETPPHDHHGQLKRLSRIRGQVDGVERMILERRYCPDIVVQIKAARAALRSLEAHVLEGHLRHCVKAAIQSKDPKLAQRKLDELLELLKNQGN